MDRIEAKISYNIFLFCPRNFDNKLTLEERESKLNRSYKTTSKYNEKTKTSKEQQKKEKRIRAKRTY